MKEVIESIKKNLPGWDLYLIHRSGLKWVATLTDRSIIVIRDGDTPEDALNLAYLEARHLTNL